MISHVPVTTDVIAGLAHFRCRRHLLSFDYYPAVRIIPRRVVMCSDILPISSCQRQRANSGKFCSISLQYACRVSVQQYPMSWGASPPPELEKQLVTGTEYRLDAKPLMTTPFSSSTNCILILMSLRRCYLSFTVFPPFDMSFVVFSVQSHFSRVQ